MLPLMGLIIDPKKWNIQAKTIESQYLSFLPSFLGYAGSYSHTCTHMWRPEIDVRFFSASLSTLLIFWAIPSFYVGTAGWTLVLILAQSNPSLQPSKPVVENYIPNILWGRPYGRSYCLSYVVTWPYNSKWHPLHTSFSILASVIF